MISTFNAVRHFKRLAKRKAQDEFPSNMMIFLCQCFELIAGSAQQRPVMTAGFSIANKYWSMANGDVDSVIEARIRCWDFWDGEEKDLRVNESLNAAIRALLCVMNPEQMEDDDFVRELFDWFFEMANVIGDFNQSFDALLPELEGCPAPRSRPREGPLKLI